MTCIICRSNSPLTIVQKFPAYSVLECKHCKYAIVDPLPSPEVLAELYNSVEYFDTHMDYDFNSISETEISKKIEFNQKLHLSNIQKYIKEGQKLLEIGSGGGFAIKALQNCNLKVTGVETSTIAKEFAKEVLGVNVINSSFEDFQTEEKYDIIMLNHVLEHFLDPRAAMDKLSKLLKKDGILYVRVPDHDSFDRRVYNKNWPAYGYYHISNFSAQSLRLLFEDFGLEVLETKKYISDKIPGIMRKLMIMSPLKRLFVKKFNGRTITIIGRAL